MSIVAARDLLISRIQGRGAKLRGLCLAPRRGLRQRRDDFRPLLANFFVTLFPGRRDAFEHLGESRLSVSIFRREISSAHERFQLGREPDAHRPAATAGRGLDERHVDAVHVRPLLAIDFDVHEFAVHDCRHFRALERLVRHDVAPVAGRITDREKDRLVLPTRFGECFLAPGKPVDRIVRVLKQVGRLLAREPVGLFRH